MAFRRTKNAAEQKKKWSSFLAKNRDLLVLAGVPLSVFEQQEMFDDLLMHGYIDHHTDPTRFCVDELNALQRECLVEVIVNYLRAGFPDPGLGIFGHDIHEMIRHRARNPGQ